MKLLFWKRNHGHHKKEQLDAIEKSAAQTHRKNINNIVKSREKAVTLNKALQQNNIVFQLANVIGPHK